MNISIFDVAGPVMVGPSSSHTAGAARLARLARVIAARPFKRVLFELHGSFAKTYRGHGTDKALIAGALGIAQDDERLKDAYALASEQKIDFSFRETELRDAHENSARITFFFEDGEKCQVTGSSTGGGQIVITRINDFDVCLTACSPTLVIVHWDIKGTVSDISWILAQNDINIATMRLSRQLKGDTACCVIETDGSIPNTVIDRIDKLQAVIHARAINIIPEEIGTEEI